MHPPLRDPADGEHGDGSQVATVPKEEGVARANPVGRPEDAGADGERMGRRRNDRGPGDRELDRLPGVDPGRRDDTALPEAALIEGDDRVPGGKTLDGHRAPRGFDQRPLAQAAPAAACVGVRGRGQKKGRRNVENAPPRPLAVKRREKSAEDGGGNDDAHPDDAGGNDPAEIFRRRPDSRGRSPSPRRCSGSSG